MDSGRSGRRDTCILRGFHGILVRREGLVAEGTQGVRPAAEYCLPRRVALRCYTVPTPAQCPHGNNNHGTPPGYTVYGIPRRFYEDVCIVHIINNNIIIVIIIIISLLSWSRARGVVLRRIDA